MGWGQEQETVSMRKGHQDVSTSLKGLADSGQSLGSALCVNTVVKTIGGTWRWQSFSVEIMPVVSLANCALAHIYSTSRVEA